MKLSPNLRPPFIKDADGTLVFRTELMAAHERIDELKAALSKARDWMLCDNAFGDPEDFRRDLEIVETALSEEVR